MVIGTVKNSLPPVESEKSILKLKSYSTSGVRRGFYTELSQLRNSSQAAPAEFTARWRLSTITYNTFHNSSYSGALSKEKNSTKFLFSWNGPLLPYPFSLPQRKKKKKHIWPSERPLGPL